jgi:hypothetical protein
MPDSKLIRDSAGSYHTADDRFAVTKEGTSWWLRDSSIHDELGMPRVSGPFATLDEIRTAIADAPAVIAEKHADASGSRSAKGRKKS